MRRVPPYLAPSFRTYPSLPPTYHLISSLSLACHLPTPPLTVPRMPPPDPTSHCPSHATSRPPLTVTCPF